MPPATPSCWAPPAARLLGRGVGGWDKGGLHPPVGRGGGLAARDPLMGLGVLAAGRQGFLRREEGLGAPPGFPVV